MIKINIVTVGKLKESYWREAEAEYIKRLTPYAEITIRELKEETFNEKTPAEMIRQKEAEKILMELQKIKDTFIVVLDSQGKQFDSLTLSNNLEKWTGEGSSITFIIGGPLGLSNEVLQKARAKLSLSSLTFTHQMARIILAEQIYRACMIKANRSYHY